MSVLPPEVHRMDASVIERGGEEACMTTGLRRRRTSDKSLLHDLLFHTLFCFRLRENNSFLLARFLAFFAEIPQGGRQSFHSQWAK